MKKFKKFVALLAATALMVALPSGNVLTASAAAPTTYLVYYLDDEWIFQTGVSAYNEDEDEDDLDDLEDVIQNNDILIIDGSSSREGVELDISNVYLSNLTVMNSDVAIVKTAGVNECYIGNNAVASVTGNVNSAWVYDTASVTFRSNVSYLELVGEEHEAEYNATCLGTVGHLKAADEDGYVYYEYYNVAADRLNIEDGEDETDVEYYSETPGAAPAAPVAPAPAAPAQNAGAAQNTTASGEYDEVPKTGEVLPAYVWLLGIAAVAFAGKVALKKA